jgi:hypothetical protein
MAYEYTNKSSNNKILSNSKILSIDSMESMSIDDIVDIYRQGYRLKEQENLYSNVESLADATIVALASGIIIAPLSASIGIGGTQQLSVGCIYNNEPVACPILTWSSSSPSVATVNSSGLVTGVAPGSTNITASYTGYTSNMCIITVPILDHISPLNASIFTETTQQFYAYDQFGQAYTTGFGWYVVSGVGSIDANGLYSAGATAGQATIGALYAGVHKTTQITVTIAPPVLSSIVITPTTASIQTGTTQQLLTTCKDQYDANFICPVPTWTKTSGVGSINASGLYSAGATAGTATITASVSGVTSNTSTITVNNPPPVLTTITVSPVSVSIASVGSQLFTAAPKDQYGNPISATITWTINNLAAGSIDPSTGVFSASYVTTNTTTTVTATSGLVSGNATATVLKSIVTCASGSATYGTGCNLLKHYAGPDGIISTDEGNLAISDRNAGLLTNDEVNYIVYECWSQGGNVNTTCPGCYVPPPPGTISVNTNNASATFTITGPATYDGTGTMWTQQNAPTGTYSIAFHTIPGYTTPTDTNKTLASGGTVYFSGSYIQKTGTLSVTTAPVFGAISIDGTVVGSGSWSGPLLATDHTVSFGTIPGYITPSTRTSTVLENQETIVTGIYVAESSPPSIEIQSMTVGGITCNHGCSITCGTNCPAIVDVVITWQNSGGSSGTFTPHITVAGGYPIPGAQITVISGGTGITTFHGVSLPLGTPNMCFDLGTIT